MTTRHEAMFGCEESELVAVRERAMELHDAGRIGRAAVDAKVAMSLLSDAQETAAMGMHEGARKIINQAKWFLEQIARGL